ncbi:MAG: Rrf2 family transcriptional regulator [Actinobacteria bacterium]|nr:Rrf2 family transcriptional regulator [Actinomycetota bacterium]
MGLQLTRGAEYAIRAMTYLAHYPEGHVASLHEIGEAQDIPESFLAKILQSLVRSGLAVSQRGAHGGFALARPATEITMQQVIEAIDGPISVNQCVLSPEDCGRSASCTVHVAWVRAQEQLMDVLGSVTLESLAPHQATSV